MAEAMIREAGSIPTTRSSVEPLAGPVERARGLLATTTCADVRGDDRWHEAGRKVLRLHFARMVARTPGVIAGEDPEEVHAMRVASRRIRAAWRVFGDGFEPEAARRYRRILRDMGERLGAVRDLDVLLGILDTHVAQHGLQAQRGLLPVRIAWAVERRARHESLAAYVVSPAFAAFVADLEGFLGTEETAGPLLGRTSPGRVRVRMPAAAWAAYGSVWAFDERLVAADGGDLAALHELRIAGKLLRYTLEFAREALAGGAAPIIDPVVALQDHLGDQHDLHVAATLARQVSEADRSLSAREAPHVERFVCDLEARVDWHGRRFSRVWRPIITPGYRARLGRALAGL